MTGLSRFIPVLLLNLCVAAFGADVKYQNDFEKAEPGTVPDDMLVLNGDFAVKEDSGNKVLELPGSPLDTFAVLFGPAGIENTAVSARIFATSKGRKFPAFEVGLNGVGGYKLRVSPAKKLLELYRGDTVKTSVPLEWNSGKWARLDLQITRRAENQWTIEGRCRQEGSDSPTASLVFAETVRPPSGRPSVGGMPFAGTPIRFDDLVVSGTAAQ